MPGRPITRIAPSLPCIIGLPGRIAMRQNAMVGALRLQRPLDEVMVADRGAAHGDQDIRFELARAADAFRGGGECVGGDAEIDDLGALGARQRPRCA